MCSRLRTGSASMPNNPSKPDVAELTRSRNASESSSTACEGAWCAGSVDDRRHGLCRQPRRSRSSPKRDSASNRIEASTCSGAFGCDRPRSVLPRIRVSSVRLPGRASGVARAATVTCRPAPALLTMKGQPRKEKALQAFERFANSSPRLLANLRGLLWDQSVDVLLDVGVSVAVAVSDPSDASPGFRPFDSSHGFGLSHRRIRAAKSRRKSTRHRLTLLAPM